MGPNYSISTACATSNFCILNAANHIIRGEAVSILHLVHSERCIRYFTHQFMCTFYFISKFFWTCRTSCFVVARMQQSYLLVTPHSSHKFIQLLLPLRHHMPWTQHSHFLIFVAGLGGFVACRALSQRNDDPMKASRPWDMVNYQWSFHLLLFHCAYLKTCGNFLSETLFSCVRERKIW